MSESSRIPRLVTARALADATGLPLWRVYELTRDGQLPHVRLGKAIRFDPETVAAWLASGGTAGAPSRGV